MIVNCDINCRSFETQHVSNVAFSNRDIIEITCFWTVISSNCVISAFNYILSVNCPIYPLFFVFMCQFRAAMQPKFHEINIFLAIGKFFSSNNVFCAFELFWCDDVKNELKKILFWCIFLKNTLKSYCYRYHYPKHPYIFTLYLCSQACMRHAHV